MDTFLGIILLFNEFDYDKDYLIYFYKLYLKIFLKVTLFVQAE